MAYLPPGKFAINDTINVSGTDFWFEGSGYGTMLAANTEHWTNLDAPMIKVGCVNGVTIGNMQAEPSGTNESVVKTIQMSKCDTSLGLRAGARKNGAAGRAPLAGPQLLILDGFFGSDSVDKQPGVLLEGLELGDTVHALHLDGGLRISNSSDATVLANFHCGQVLQIDDAVSGRRGQVVQLVRVSSAAFPVINIENSLSAVILDHYHEGTGTFMQLRGPAPKGKHPGSVSVSNPKLNVGGSSGAPLVVLHDFDGALAHTSTGAGYS